jgi:hypothetical protein
MELEHSADVYRIVRVHIVRNFNLAIGINNAQIGVPCLQGRNDPVNIVESEKFCEIVRPVSLDQQPLGFEIPAKKFIGRIRMDQSFE